MTSTSRKTESGCTNSSCRGVDDDDEDDYDEADT